MNFSLFIRRLVSLPASRTYVASSSVLTSSALVATRRTFFTTRRIQLPAAPTESTSTAQKTKRKPAAPKTKAKAGTKAKAKAKAKPKKAEKPAQPTKVPKSEQPPTRPPNAYILFFTKMIHSQKDSLKNIEDTQAASKMASAAWKNFTLAEKQPYFEEAEILRKQYDVRLEDYWKNAPPDVLKRINARRIIDGKKRIHRPRQEGDTTKPLVPFFRFVQEFRQSPDAKAIYQAGSTSEGSSAVNVSREAGRRWQAMSPSDKAPYVEAYQRENADWQANHPKNVAASAPSHASEHRAEV